MIKARYGWKVCYSYRAASGEIHDVEAFAEGISLTSVASDFVNHFLPKEAAKKGWKEWVLTDVMVMDEIVIKEG